MGLLSREPGAPRNGLPAQLCPPASVCCLWAKQPPVQWPKPSHVCREGLCAQRWPVCGRWASACWGGSLHGHIQGWPLRTRDARAVCPLLAQVMFSRRSRPCPEAGLHVSRSALSLFVGLLGPDRKLTRSVCDLLRGPRQAGSVTHTHVEPCGLGTESWGSPPVSEHPRVDASGARLALCVRPWPPADAAARLERTPVAWSTWRVGQCLGTSSPFVSPQLAARLSREETRKDPREARPPSLTPSSRRPRLVFPWEPCHDGIGVRSPPRASCRRCG